MQAALALQPPPPSPECVARRGGASGWVASLCPPVLEEDLRGLSLRRWVLDPAWRLEKLAVWPPGREFIMTHAAGGEKGTGHE